MPKIADAAAAWPPTDKFEDAPSQWRRWFFDSMADGFTSALHSEEETARDLRIGGKTIRLRFAGQAHTHELTRAFAHLASEAKQQPDLDISMWDASQAAPPAFLLKAYLTAMTHAWWEFLNPRGELIDFHGHPLMAAYHPGSDVLSLLDCERNAGLYWRRTASIPYYEAASPLRTLLHWWFRGQGMQFVHAAAVANGGAGVLLVGKGGSGKSTAALACVDAGFQYAGDDYAMVQLHPHPRVHSLYNSCKLVGDDDVARFPGLAARVWNARRTQDEKATLFLHEHWPGQVTRDFALKAIVIPRVTGKRETSLTSCRGFEALTAIAPSTMAQLPSSDAQDLHFLKELVQAVPSFVMETGTDLPGIPRAIGNLLARISE